LALPVGRVHDLLQDLTEDERLGDFLEGARIEPADSHFTVSVGEHRLAVMEADGTSSTLVASHLDLPLPSLFFSGADKKSDPLLAAQLTFENTEKDSGETFFSKLSLISSIDYTLQAAENGNWFGQLRVNWPPMVGLAAKPFVGRTRQSYFVPHEAFASAVMRITGTGQALDSMVGFEEGEGPIKAHAADDLCVTIMPGTGVLPVPDVVLQTRITEAEKLIKSAQT
jgi:hypothetical protein